MAKPNSPPIISLSDLSRIVLAVLATTVSHGFAASDSWKIDAAGNWNGVANWLSGSQYPNGVGDVATFNYNITAARTVTLTTPIAVGGITFSDSSATGQGGTSNNGYQLALGANNLTLDAVTTGYHSGDLAVISVPATNAVGHYMYGTTGKLVLTDDVQFNIVGSAGGIEMSIGSGNGGLGLLSGTGNILKTGQAQLLLTGDNAAYTGNIRVSEGMLQVRASNKAFGTGVITLTNGSSNVRGATVSFNNYSAAPTFTNIMVWEQASGVTSAFNPFYVINTDVNWSGNISSVNASAGDGASLGANVNLSPYGRPSIMTNLIGDNSGLKFSPGKGFITANYLGVGSASALGTGNAAYVQVGNTSYVQSGVLATAAVSIGSKIDITNAGNAASAVIGGTIASGTARYSGLITLNSNNSTGLRQSLFRSDTGGTVVFDSASVIASGTSNGTLAPVTKIGGGRVAFNGANTYLGTTAVRSGELVAGNANALGATANTTTVSLGDATTVLAAARVASKGNENFGTYASGTITGAATSIDGVTLVAGDRVLLKDNTTAWKNGVYVVQTPTTTWVRDTAFDSMAEEVRGVQVSVTAGTVNAGRTYFLTQSSTTYDSSGLDWQQDVANPDVSILNNGVTISRNIAVVANGSTGKSILGGINTAGTATFSGNVALSRDLTVSTAAGGNVDFTGAMTGGYGVTKEGTGTVVFSNAKTYVGGTTVSAGTLKVNGPFASSGVTVNAGAILQGNGVLSNGVTVVGTVAPGDAIGTLAVGSASFAVGGTLAVEIDGSAGDQLVATGELNLNGAVLSLIPVGSGLTQASYVVAQGSPLVGAFASVPLGYTVRYTANQVIINTSAYYVSPSGSDTANNGLSAASPFATIQKAANMMLPGDTCFIRGGIYRESVTVPRSGAPNAPITFAAYPNERVTISGSDPIASWTLESPNVYRAVSMPAGWATLGDKNQVFQGSGTQDSLLMRPEARWPNAGAAFPWQDSSVKPSPDWSYVETAGYDANRLNGWFTDAHLPTRADDYWKGAKVHIMLGDGWYTFNPAVKGYSDATKTMLTDESHGPNQDGSHNAYTMKAGNEYYLTGKKGEMDSAGEWFYDTSTNRLCFYSTSEPANVEVKSRPYGFKFSGKSFINLANIDLFACMIDPTAPYATDCVLDGLHMKYLSHSRLRDGVIGLSLGSRCVLRNSELAYSSSGLLAMCGSDMRVINNHIHDSAYVPAGVGAITASGYGANQYAANRNLISHNTIHSVGHAAIGYPGRSVIIEYNDIYDGMRGSSDGGLCYWAMDGGNGTFRYNLLHDSHGPVGHSGNGVQGFYLDNENSGWIVHHNIIWNISGFAMQINAPCSYDMVFNNTAWNCSSGAILNSFWVDGPTGNRLYNNLFNGTPVGNQSVWSQSDLRNNRFADPLLVDPAKQNFQLQGISPALDAGIVIPGVTDGFSGTAPDLGALESGAGDWTAVAGCKSTQPVPEPVYVAPEMTYANQVRDGGFESGGLLPNWTVRPGSNVGLIHSNAWVDHKLHSSYFGLQFGGGAAESEISQTVTGLQAGKQYKFYSTVQKTDPAAVVKVGVRDYGYPDLEVTVPTNETWGGNNVARVPSIFEVPFVTGPGINSATIYIKVTRAAGSSVAPKNTSNGAFPTVAASIVDLSGYGSSATVEPMYPANGVYVDDLCVELAQENTDPLSYRMPVALYQFDESGGLIANDATPHGKNATLSGATFAPGRQGNALTFLGTGQYAKAASVAVPSAGGSFTVAFWLKFANIAAGEYPKPVNNAGWLKKGWHITSGPDYGLGMYLFSKDNSLDTDNPATGMAAWLSHPLEVGVWTHVAYVFDRTNGVLRSYRNGVADNYSTMPAGFGEINITTGLQLGIGFSNGQMDDFQLWECALNAREIAAVVAPDPSLELRLKFDESAGASQAWDSSVYRRTGVLTNMASSTAWVSGMVNGALAFDGVDDYIVTPTITTPTAVTVACWAKSATPIWNASGCLVSGLSAFVLSPEQGSRNLQFIVYSSPTTRIATPSWMPPASFDITQWHHYAGVFNPTIGRAELYVDGVLVSLLATSASMNIDAVPVFIGKDGNSGGCFRGDIDDVRMYSRALTWCEMLETSRQTDAQPYAATTSVVLARDEDGDGLPTSWEQLYGLDPMVVNNPADDQSDHDGLGLLLEYAFNQSSLADSSAVMPRATTVVDAVDHQSYLTFNYLRRTDAPQLIYTVQVSDDLKGWASDAAHVREISATPSGDGITEIVTARILPAIDAANGRRVARLSVSHQ